jgi:hypothetical protein
MLAFMQTIAVNELVSEPEALLVSASFEPCTTYGADGDGSPVCAACGWLEAEHEPPVAEVHVLPAREMPRRTPKRLAS